MRYKISIRRVINPTFFHLFSSHFVWRTHNVEVGNVVVLVQLLSWRFVEILYGNSCAQLTDGATAANLLGVDQMASNARFLLHIEARRVHRQLTRISHVTRIVLKLILEHASTSLLASLLHWLVVGEVDVAIFAHQCTGMNIGLFLVLNVIIGTDVCIVV